MKSQSGMCNNLQQKFAVEVVEKKRKFSYISFNISKCIGVDLSVVEGLFSLLF